MNCMSCGRPVANDARFCPHCGHGIPGLDGTPRQQMERPPTKSGMSPALIVVLVVVVVAVVVAGAFGTLLLSSATLGKPDLRKNLTLVYSEGGLFSDPYVSVEGTVYNYGDIGCYATLHCTIRDDRGWSISPIIELSWIGPSGGHVNVDKNYDWPSYYNGQFADGDDLHWSCYFTWTT